MPYDPIHHSYMTFLHFIMVNKSAYTSCQGPEIMTPT